MPTPMHITDAADLYDPSIQKMFIKTAGKDPEDYKKVCTVETGVTDYVRKDSSISGLGEADFVDPENAVLTRESPVQGFDQTYTQFEVGKILSFTKRMWFFGIKKRDMTKITNELVNACIRKRERLVAERFDNGWATSYSHSDGRGTRTISTAGGDGVAAFSNAHTREDGGANWNNIVFDGTTYNMDFDYDALKAAHRTASLITDPKGNIMQDLNLDTLVCRKGSTPYFKALEILGAIKKNHKPGSADYDDSGVMAFKMIVLPRLTNFDYYYMMDSSQIGGYEYGFQYLESEAINLSAPTVLIAPGEIQYKSCSMFTLGHNDMRKTVASKGTNTL